MTEEYCPKLIMNSDGSCSYDKQTYENYKAALAVIITAAKVENQANKEKPKRGNKFSGNGVDRGGSLKR